MQTVYICPNLQKAGMLEAVKETCDVLLQEACTVLLPVALQEDMSALEDVSFCTQREGVQRADFIVVLGGDGTILRIAAQAALQNVPLIGVNLGHLGFMTELERSDLKSLHKVLVGKYDIDCRMMLDLRVMRNGKICYTSTALNEITVTKHNPFRVIRVDICADGVPVSGFQGDGVIIATPTGTTAYSLAAGGPVIEPWTEDIAVTPICAHALRTNSFVFSAEREISVAAMGMDGTGVCVSADGGDGFVLWPEDRIFVTKSSQITRLIRVKGRSFYHVLREKLSEGGTRR